MIATYHPLRDYGRGNFRLRITGWGVRIKKTSFDRLKRSLENPTWRRCLDWFERLTGFQETDYAETRARLVVDGDRLKFAGQRQKLCRWRAGTGITRNTSPAGEIPRRPIGAPQGIIGDWGRAGDARAVSIRRRAISGRVPVLRLPAARRMDPPRLPVQTAAASRPKMNSPARAIKDAQSRKRPRNCTADAAKAAFVRVIRR